MGYAAISAGLPTSAFADSSESNKAALFVQHSDTATLSDGTLTLDDIDKNMIAFSDHPMRSTMFPPTAGLIEILNKGKDSFSEDPPNAVFMGEVDRKATSLIGELTNPALSDGSLTFDYVLLKGEDSVTLVRSYMVLDETVWGDIDWEIDKGTGNQEGAATMDNLPD